MQKLWIDKSVRIRIRPKAKHQGHNQQLANIKKQIFRTYIANTGPRGKSKALLDQSDDNIAK